MPKVSIVDILAAKVPENSEALVEGWVRTRRDAKGFSFLEINDGSCLANLQVVAGEEIAAYDEVKNAHTGAAVSLRGLVTASPGGGQKWEVRAAEFKVVGPAAPEAYPLQKKRHSDEFLREIAHLRARTNKFGAMFRLRSRCAWATHDFFRARGFFQVHTPVITGSDCEGAGELFRVTTLPAGGGKIEDDFFGREAGLTVSGQLEGELLALALGKIYVFGPAFRAENSNTPRHAAEFWMIEPEMAFADLRDDMDLAEALIKHVVSFALDEAREDLALFDRFVEPGLFARLENMAGQAYARLPYAEAVDLLKTSKKKFEFKPEYGMDLQTEHERFLCEEHFKKPVFVHDYPAAIKPFYMRLSDDGRTAAAMDLLAPKVGELVGGSQREERLDVLEKRMDETGMNKENYEWYLDSRRFGTAPHAGFGLGFERLLMMLTGASNIRDVIPFPRTPKNLEF
ncbi:MAG: asparagine--tRNA ligase [Candidatus Adiutrix sp.]|jgi:asparaginyl-tRNA synthetase|nr:asparagine--tRNA ligase [Candidatus Adiutrix sp.]